MRRGPRECVVCVKLEAMAHALAETEIEAVVMRTANRFVVPNACELRRGSTRGSKSIQRSLAASSTHGYALIDVDGLDLVATENVGILRLEPRVGNHRPAIPAVAHLRHRMSIDGIHQSPE